MAYHCPIVPAGLAFVFDLLYTSMDLSPVFFFSFSPIFTREGTRIARAFIIISWNKMNLSLVQSLG